MNIDEKKGERVSGKVSYIYCERRIHQFTDNAEVASTIKSISRLTFRKKKNILQWRNYPPENGRG